jgi:cytoskeletal protein CcmA (bactofilin family)
MSFLHLKNKTEPKYAEARTATIHKDVFDTKSKPENKIIGNSKSSLMIGDQVTITGTIKASNEVTIQGTVDGDIECNSVTINKSGNVKGKIKTETMTVEGKVEGEMNVNAVLNIKSEGYVSGKVFYGEIQIDEGGKLSGEINHRDKDKKQEEFKELKSLS